MQAFLEQITVLALASPWLLAVLLGMAVVDALLPVVPSEALIIAAGVASATGQQNLLVVIGVAALGSFIGETAGYLIGRWFGPAVRDRWAADGVRAAGYDRVSRLLDARGGTVLLTARFLPGGRTVATVAAGAMQYPTGRFLTFTALGTPLSAAWSASLGYFGGATFAEDPLLGLAVGLSVGTAVGLLAGVVQRLRARATGPTPAVARVSATTATAAVGPATRPDGADPARVLTGAAAS